MAKQLNDNNFLRWSGGFATAPFTVVANNDTASVVLNIPSIDIMPLANDTATNGIDPYSLVITLQDNLIQPATWNGATQKLTYFLPAGVVPGNRALKYKFSDANGNVSNEATITITILARPTGWRGYGPSYTCQLVDGVRNGKGIYTSLEKYYTDDNTAVVPSTLKSNTSGDPDYIPPVDDVNCNTEHYQTWVLNNGEELSVCLTGVTTTLYSDDTVIFLTTGVFLYTDISLVSPADNGYYSDGSYKYRIVGGQIVNLSFC